MHGRDKESFRGWTMEWWVVCAREGLSVKSGEDVRSRGEALHAKELTFILKSGEKPWWVFKKYVNLEDHFDYHVESSSCGVNRKRQRDSWKAAGLIWPLIWYGSEQNSGCLMMPLLKLWLQKEMWIEGKGEILNAILSAVNFVCLWKTQVAVTRMHFYICMESDAQK